MARKRRTLKESAEANQLYLATEKPGARGVRDASDEAMTRLDARYIADIRREIMAAGTLEKLNSIAGILKTKGVVIRNAVRGDWAKRRDKIKGETK